MTGGGESSAQDAPRRRRGRSRRPRRDPETARARFLAAGLELVAERSLGDTLAHLRISDLAHDAGLTSGAFYHYWSGQESYRAEVVAALLAGDRLDADPDLYRPPERDDRDRPADAEDPAAVVDEVVGRAQDRLFADPDHRLELALWAHDEPGVLARVRERAQAADAAMAGTLGDCLARSGRRPAGRWDRQALATAAVTLGDGLRTLHLIDSAALAPDVEHDGRSWHRTSLLALLLLVGATEPGAAARDDEPTDPRPDPSASGMTGEEDGDTNLRRQRLVALGVDAARARPTGNAFDHVRADDVARRLGLTIGAFYHYWDSQEDYRDDLVDALFATDRYVEPERIEARADRLAELSDLDTAIRETTTWYWSIAAGHPENRVHFAFETLDDPYITPRLAQLNAELRRAFHTVLDAMLERFARRWRPPLTTELVVIGLGAALDGLVVRYGLDPDGLDPDDEGWTLWGRTCRALILAGTTGDPADERDLPTLAREALAG